MSPPGEMRTDTVSPTGHWARAVSLSPTASSTISRIGLCWLPPSCISTIGSVRWTMPQPVIDFSRFVRRDDHVCFLPENRDCRRLADKPNGQQYDQRDDAKEQATHQLHDQAPAEKVGRLKTRCPREGREERRSPPPASPAPCRVDAPLGRAASGLGGSIASRYLLDQRKPGRIPSCRQCAT